MSEISKYEARLRQLELDRRAMIREMMQRPFGDRVMSDARESELDQIERELLEKPPIIGTNENGGPVFAGRGLLPEPEDRVLDTPPTSIQVIPQSQWPAYIDGQNGEEQLHVKRYVKHVLSQQSIGSCAGEGITGAIMAVENQSGQTPTKLNGYFPYHWSSGGSDRGSTLSENIRVVQQYGVASEAVWPRSNGFRRTPSAEAMEDALQHRLLKFERLNSWAEYGTCLLMGWPVYSGYSGHAWYGVRLISPTRLEYANSWSPNWGDGGFGTLSERSVMWSYGVYVVRSAAENRP